MFYISCLKVLLPNMCQDFQKKIYIKSRKHAKNQLPINPHNEAKAKKEFFSLFHNNIICITLMKNTEIINIIVLIIITLFKESQTD